MTQRVALVTGGARGIGAATVRALVAENYAVVVVDLGRDLPGVPYAMGSKDDLALLRADLGDAIQTVEGDVRELSTLQQAVQVAKEHFGGLDVAIAGAGLATGGVPVWEQTEESFLANVSVNLLGVHQTAVAAIPALLERPKPRSGRFLAISSTAGLIGQPKLTAYSASKHGVIGYVKGLAADLGTTGVTANAVLPGSTRTAILEACAAMYDLNSVEEFAVHHLNERLLEPEELAAVLVFLAGEASSAITGAAIPVDGGMTAS